MRELELCREFVPLSIVGRASAFLFLAKSGQRSHVATVFDYRAGTIFLSPLMPDAAAQIRMTEGSCRGSSTLY